MVKDKELPKEWLWNGKAVEIKWIKAIWNSNSDRNGLFLKIDAIKMQFGINESAFMHIQKKTNNKQQLQTNEISNITQILD